MRPAALVGLIGDPNMDTHSRAEIARQLLIAVCGWYAQSATQSATLDDTDGLVEADIYTMLAADLMDGSIELVCAGGDAS